tara:strand:+ start:2488 stop:4200 length:1713 start_codon:yes stop_codon:yes gene_type:complete
MGLIQILGVGSIIPFVSLLVNPELVERRSELKWFYEAGGFSDVESFIFVIGVGVLIVLVLGNAFSAFTIWLIAKFTWGNQVYLSSRLLQNYIQRPYEFFIGRNSSDISKNVLFESMQLTQGVLVPAINILAFGITGALIIGFLFWLNPLLTLITTCVFVISYLVIYLFIRRPLDRLGGVRLTANSERFRSVHEAFGSIKEVKILNREHSFVRRYEGAARVFGRTLISQQVLALLPRYVIETALFSMLMSVLLYMLYIDVQMENFLPMASAFAFAGYRLLPIMQRVFSAANALRFNSSVLDSLHSDMIGAADVGVQTEYRDDVNFRDEICVEGVSYQYPESVGLALKEIDLAIPRGSFVALVGETGSGKTTLADILLGLLAPKSGRLLVDGVELDGENMRAWRSKLGYVPQNIYLVDNSVAANIAFGIPEQDIDWMAVERAAKTANIHDFVADQLVDGYRTIVGERGVKLSGGQRQRIGIARALYHNPEVLILDEATNALDSVTEESVHLAMMQAAEEKTVLVIAHRFETIRNCDRIFVLDAGAVIASGTYTELFESSSKFRNLANNLSAG